MQNPYAERIATARGIAQTILALCDSYEHAPSPMTINRFLTCVEQLADLAEDIEVEQIIKALDD